MSYSVSGTTITLTRGDTFMADITISQVPYWETSNISNGMTVYIAKEV